MKAPLHLYAIGLGSNRPHGRYGRPPAVIAAAGRALGDRGRLIALSPIVATAPLGPSARRFANAAALLESPLPPPDLLSALKAIERRFGRRRGQRWGPRVIDLDILLWSGGLWRGPDLAIPHPALTRRLFVLDPLATIAAGWRPPRGALTIRHLASRLTKATPVHRDRNRSGP
ncbi:2-amino-4-hydroxy-6-hydroxymethyldihydropteridine diphosphokinase [Sphingomonas vulcanisoli]|uniref:2-amino-4-hydroxy-6-hydroxymethyldihydropteridine pyrophosphokinase n=1 Tax=Sphingomonas vulcanisoli TaxID=1658060 RepID=A0ABX0TW22_9SPHN|nr:2-amino-4-hydroxy-6-hydroxymethyldihydropteridine diphosphokinase [Sphingomonas vulcanisoli]NIJ08909.1 2-amino-4-hydroxy-6-hydroxymethyldihydropteridine diphosphokinase [Sphingomonas vulcanisoli]